MIREQNKEKCIVWARENLNNNFDNIVWTDESINDSTGESSHILLLQRRSSMAKGESKTFIQSYGMGRHLQERCYKHRLSERLSKQQGIPGGTPDTHCTIS